MRTILVVRTWRLLRAQVRFGAAAQSISVNRIEIRQATLHEVGGGLPLRAPNGTKILVGAAVVWHRWGPDRLPPDAGRDCDQFRDRDPQGEDSRTLAAPNARARGVGEEREQSRA